MSTSLRERVNEAFDGKDAENVQRFLDLALSSEKQVSDSITRAVLLILLLAAIFELLISSATVSGLTLGPVSFRDTSLLQQFIPALVAYLLYDINRLLDQLWDSRNAYRVVMEKFQPKLVGSGLMDLVLPTGRGPFSMDRPIRGYPRSGDKFNQVTTGILSYFIGFMLPIGFEVHAYYRLMQKYGLHNALVWISMVVSAIIIIVWLVKIIVERGDRGVRI